MIQTKFEEMDISREIQKAIDEMGFEEATPIQAQAIPHIFKGEDVIGQAQTGTGKTAAFGIPLLDKIDSGNKGVQAVILSPTRELAIQVAEELKELSKYKQGIDILPIYGGQPIERQIKALKKGVQVIIGTPGRVMDHMRRRTLKLSQVKMVVLDEADEMLDMGFREDIEKILQDIPQDRQTLMFSATMPKPILELTEKYQRNPKFIKVVHKELTVPNIEQYYLEVKEKSKLEVLSRLIDFYNPNLSLIFCNTKKRVDELLMQLQARGYSAEGLHGDMSQSQRDRVMEKFRSGSIDILVATDVAARGLDVSDVDAVFNYDVPQNEEYYVHRIGRTGRAGRPGKAFSLVVGRDIYKLKDIQKYTRTKIVRKDVPSQSDVEETRTNSLLEKLKEVVDEGGLGKYTQLIEKLIEEDYTSMDLAAALLKMVLVKEQEDGREEGFENIEGAPEMVRLFINIGRSQKIRPGDIVGAIAGETGMPGKLIGTIDIYDKFTFVEVPKEYAQDVLSIMKNNQIKGKKINIEPAR
ncbi:DEAD/DEAH box helicase [Biomaibacter acetigenes]|jgi:ATP-dependent RNA helicase DeaD|uniref:ATP-dependent RNA helicase CshA n=1 Tax=Biomaibacter acetigenes TaxID=2316383 RepID=A0A3G2R780_9FIRM|nr:DEAD/DEAH box helicase [Biomaibacter acetigenes]AYO31225.1 DEAD/DEAH box helicase [Biomaibacter acetigenes]